MMLLGETLLASGAARDAENAKTLTGQGRRASRQRRL